MRRPTKIVPPKGKLGILTVGMGAVATTFMAGVDMVRNGQAAPIGSVTQMGTIRLGKRTEDLAKSKKFLSAIRPMKAAFDRNYVKRLDGPNVKKAKTKYDLALEIKEDIARFAKQHKVSRVVVIWCGSTEIFLMPEEVHSTVAKFEEGMKKNHPAIAPSMLYAWAAITSGVPFANGAPYLTVDLPCMQQLAQKHG